MDNFSNKVEIRETSNACAEMDKTETQHGKNHVHGNSKTNHGPPPILLMSCATIKLPSSNTNQTMLTHVNIQLTTKDIHKAHKVNQ